MRARDIGPKKNTWRNNPTYVNALIIKELTNKRPYH